MGQFLGKLHHLSKSYQFSSPRHRRFDIERDFTDMEQTGINHLPPKDALILDVYRDLVEQIRSLPKNAESYGLIHIDFHRGNFFITDEGKTTLFDFDDCQSAWFIYGIAMALFYAIPHDCHQKKIGITPRFF
jgi:amicoumacin kinase